MSQADTPQQAVEDAVDEVQEALNTLEDAVEGAISPVAISDGEDDKQDDEVLFTHSGYDVVEEFDVAAHGISVYRDEDGDAAVEVKEVRLLLGSHGESVADAILEADTDARDPPSE